jgi:hypothetical protein
MRFFVGNNSRAVVLGGGTGTNAGGCIATSPMAEAIVAVHSPFRSSLVNGTVAISGSLENAPPDEQWGVEFRVWRGNTPVVLRATYNARTEEWEAAWDTTGWSDLVPALIDAVAGPMADGTVVVATESPKHVVHVCNAGWAGVNSERAELADLWHDAFGAPVDPDTPEMPDGEEWLRRFQAWLGSSSVATAGSIAAT